MRKKVLARFIILFMIFSLILPAFSVGAEGSNGKVFHSKLQEIQYQYSSDLLQKNLNREKSGNIDERLEELKGRQVDKLKGSLQLNDSSKLKGSQKNVESKIEPKNYVPASDSDKMISVIVELQAEPTAAFNAKVKQGLVKGNLNQKAIIEAEQRNFKLEASKKLNAKIHQTYSHVFNGFALNIQANKVDQLLEISGVKAVYPDHEMYATNLTPDGEYNIMMDRSAPHIGAEHFWNLGVTGRGIKVGVLDTGIDYLHPDLMSAYKGGWDFIDNDNDPYETTPGDHQNDPSNPPPVNERGSTYWTSHGTHVAGTIAGRGAAPGGVKGVAPEAEIYAYRVLGPYGSGSNSGVIAGIERSVLDGMDVINLSLGGGANNQNSPDSIAVNNAMLDGVVVAVSAGNSGPNDRTITNPASAEMVITVGNSVPPTEVPALNTPGLNPMIGNMLEYSPGFGNLDGQTLEVVFAGLGKPSDFVGIDVTGKIALISRGEISFHDKSVNAQNAGAAVVIIYNNAPGNFNGTLGEPGNYIPTFSLSQEDGLNLKNKLDTDGSLSAQLGYDQIQDFMNDSSSRGPALPGYAIKPDIAAPGTSISSSVPAYGKEDPNADYSNAYASFTGTSMAAPHIAGAAALLLEMYGGIDQFEVKSLMMNNAVKVNDEDGNRYRHMDQGAGRVDLVKASDAKAIALVKEATSAVRGGNPTQYYTGSISFGQINAGTSDSREIMVKDFAGVSSSYSISTRWYGSSGGNISTSADEVNVNPGGDHDFTLTLQIPASQSEGYYEGELILTEDDGTRIQIPISVYVGEATIEEDVVSSFEINPDVFSPNADGIYDTTDITFDLNQSVEYFSLDVHDVYGDWLGFFVEAAYLDPASYIVRDWDGSILFWGVFPIQLWDDLYLMVPWYDDGSGLDYEENAVTPFIIDTEAPETSLSNPALVADPVTSTGLISGSIDDDLLLQLVQDGILLNPLSDLFGAGVLYQENGQWKQVDGVVDQNGTFSITVPLKEGDNQFEVYVYDAAGNGLLVPAHIVDYHHEGGQAGAVKITAQTSKEEVNLGEVFTIDIDFSQVEDLYSAQFNLTYDHTLTKGNVTPSQELATYQAQHSSTSLIVSENVYGQNEGKPDYIISLAGDFPGYTGTGSLFSYQFSSDVEGVYNFVLSNVRLLDSNGNDIELGEITSTSVTVRQVSTEYEITGNISAEGFGSGVNYNETWYSGADGLHKVIVEAVGEDGHVYHGTVYADGSYKIRVTDEGEYTVRVVVPSHFGASKSAQVVGQDVMVNFGPLTAGDVNGDGVIDLVDLQQVAKAFGKSAPWSDAKSSAADINRDGEVDMLDISFILNNFGKRK